MVICKITDEVDVISNKKQMCFTAPFNKVEAHTTVITDRHQCSYTLPD